MDQAAVEATLLWVLKEQGPHTSRDLRIKIAARLNLLVSLHERQFDRILRRLRIGGKIEFSGARWHSRETVRCERCQGKGYHDAPAFVSE